MVEINLSDDLQGLIVSLRGPSRGLELDLLATRIRRPFKARLVDPPFLVIANIYIDHGGLLREAWLVHPRI
jgi:hypothetical protein